MPKKRQNKGGYITRTQAIRYLQISLADFRRLCILKGIYPRDLSGRAKRKIQKGSTKPLTAYYRKDIQYLAHEPVLDRFRAHKIFARKLSHAIGRGDYGDAQRIDANRPRYTLDHIIKERYPTFVDAVGDLDDALSMLFLFAQMPSSDKVSHRITEEASRLSTEWMAFVAREHLLRKVFVSIKGVYYQATVHGQEVTWVVPHKFPHNISEEIDFRIMLTFLEFYTTLVHFVLFKLYTDANLVYPPPINKTKEKGVGGIGTYILESQSPQALKLPTTKSKKNKKSTVEVSMEKAQQADAENNDESDEDSDESEDERKLDKFEQGGEGGDLLAQPADTRDDLLFSKFTFFVGREVSLELVEFVALAFGARVISEAAIDELIDNENEKMSNNPQKIKVNLDGVTHQICDRPAVSAKVPGRVYVQPQWLLDSVNRRELQPVGAYAPGESLPPHLSPWGDRGTYDPEAKDEDEDEAEDSEDEEDAAVEGEAAEEGEAVNEAEKDSEDDEDVAAQRELQLESQGVKFSEAPSSAQKKSKSKKAVDEDKELRKTMMSKKQRVLYDKVQGGIDKEQERQDQLRKRRKQLKK